MRKICLIVAFLAGCIVILYTLNYETSVLLRERVGSISHAGCRNEGLSTVNNTLPRYIFGHSTGHSGSTTSHATLREARCCPWSLPSVSSFEKIFQFERPPPEDDDCTTTRTKLIPMLESLIGREPIATTYLDMGHYRNRGRTLECLAEHTRPGEAVFLHLRRDRYAVANSFINSRGINTPCTVAMDVVHGKPRRPSVALCPHSGEKMGRVDLPVASDGVWMSMTPFQKFLWYVDEMEHRWHGLRLRYEGRGVRMMEVTWMTSDELRDGLRRVQAHLGCETKNGEGPSRNIANKKKHVKHSVGGLNCSEMVLQDLAYRGMMNYDDGDYDILFARHAQRLDGEDCMDSREDLARAIEVGGGGGEWVLPQE